MTFIIFSAKTIVLPAAATASEIVASKGVLPGPTASAANRPADFLPCPEGFSPYDDAAPFKHTLCIHQT